MPRRAAFASTSGHHERADHFVRCIAQDWPIQMNTAEEGLEITRVLWGLLQSTAEGKQPRSGADGVRQNRGSL